MATAKLLSATYDIVRVMAADKDTPNRVPVSSDMSELETTHTCEPTSHTNATDAVQTPGSHAPETAENGAVLPSNSGRITVGSQCPVDTCLRADVDLSRQCFGLHTSEQLRYWIVLQELRRENGHQGFTQQQLSAALEKYGIKNVAAHFKRVLWRGVGLFWNLHDCMVYPCGYIELTQRVQRKAALAGLHDLYLENPAGAHRDMYLNVSGALADFDSQILAGWYAMRGNPTISRYCLEILFNTDSRTLRRLEKRAGIHIQYNEAETHDPADVPLGTDGDLRADVWRTKDRGHTVWHWRLPNTYHTGHIKQHYKRGQGRRAASILKQDIENRLADNIAVGNVAIPGKLNRVKLNYCENDKAAKRTSRRKGDGVIYVPHRPGDRDVLVWGVYKAIC